MRRFIPVPGVLVATLLISPVVAVLGYEGGRIAEYRRAIAAAQHAAAALEGALGACRLRTERPGGEAAERDLPDLTLG